MSEKVNKAYEVALACAAQDGLEPAELQEMAESISTVPILAASLRGFFEEQMGSEVEGEELDIMEIVEGLPKLMEKIDDLEITTIDDAYMEDAVSVMGESMTINNLCAAMCCLFCAADGDISVIESKSIEKVLAHLPNTNPDIFQPLAEKIHEGFNLG